TARIHQVQPLALVEGGGCSGVDAGQAVRVGLALPADAGRGDGVGSGELLGASGIVAGLGFEGLAERIDEAGPAAIEQALESGDEAETGVLGVLLIGRRQLDPLGSELHADGAALTAWIALVVRGGAGLLGAEAAVLDPA